MMFSFIQSAEPQLRQEEFLPYSTDLYDYKITQIHEPAAKYLILPETI